MNNYKKNIIISLKEELGRLFILSFTVFLFILFFQPFPLEMLDYNNRLLFVTGFGAITFILSCIIFILLPGSFPKWFKVSEWESEPPFLLRFFFIIFTTTAFAFYIRFVGMVPMTLYITFKILLVCLLPLIILIILNKIKSFERLINTLRDQNKYCISQLREYEKNGGDEKIEIISENKSDRLNLKLNLIVAIKSADNYIEIFYLRNNLIEKKLLRNTLKNIELQLVKQKHFIRCHRTSIVNIMHIKELTKSYSGYSVKMNNLEDKIPVARQYLVLIKEAISTK